MPENKKISVTVFCNWQGLGANDRFVLNKKYPETIVKTYEEWYDELKDLFVLGDKKQFGVEQDITNKKTK